VAMDVDSDASLAPQAQRRRSAVKAGYICGDQNLRHLRADLDIRHPFRSSNNSNSSSSCAESTSQVGSGNAAAPNPLDALETHIDWDSVETLLAYGTVDAMSTNPAEYPLLFAENNFTSPRDQVGGPTDRAVCCALYAM